MLKKGCFSGCIQNVPKSVGGTLGPDGKMRTGEATTNSPSPPAPMSFVACDLPQKPSIWAAMKRPLEKLWPMAIIFASLAKRHPVTQGHPR